MDKKSQETEDSILSDFVELAQLAGVNISRSTISIMLKLLNLGYSPAAIKKTLREVAKNKSRHEKTGTTLTTLTNTDSE